MNILQEKAEELAKKIADNKAFQDKYGEYESRGEFSGAQIELSVTEKKNGGMKIIAIPVFDPYKYVELSED